MKKTIMILSVLILLMALTSLIGNKSLRSARSESSLSQSLNNLENKAERDRSRRIAILTPVAHPSLELIEKGFKETFNAALPGIYSFKTYNSQGSHTLMRSEIEEISKQDYALLFTIGAQATQMAKEVLKKKGKELPIVFSAVSNPVELHIIASEESSQNNMTGVKEMTDFEAELAMLQSLEKEIRNVMLVYDPTKFGLEGDKRTIAALLARSNITLTAVEVFRTNEIMQKLTPHINKADVVMILKDNTVVPALDVLIKICAQNQVVLLASDLDSFDKGAALAYGVGECIYGTEGAEKALLVLRDELSPSAIPITPPPAQAFTAHFNEKVLKQLGVGIKVAPLTKIEGERR